MNIKQQIERDLKQAMLSGDKTLTNTLRVVKSAILNLEVAQNVRETGLSDEDAVQLLVKEAKKRQESADLYVQGGNQERAEAELAEKAVIGHYLPEQMSDEALVGVIDEIIAGSNVTGLQAMGQVIGQVKQKVGSSAEGSRIARLVKERLAS